MLSIDLNCDMGEGMGDDERIMPWISSVNIACGGHTGDADSMRRTIELALSHGVAIGAHPSYTDRTHFGRIDLLVVAENSRVPGARADLLAAFSTQLLDQLATLRDICTDLGARVHHVKPHGALYNRAAKDKELSELVCRTVREFDPGLLLYGLAGSQLAGTAERYGLRYVHEVFADRTYRADGSLTPRTEPGALIEDPVQAISQVLELICEGRVTSTSGSTVRIPAQTICIHGDGSQAAVFAEQIRSELDRQGIVISAPL